MSRRLPPLNSLRAFEAAGRHLSFTKAAAELMVTQAAISHQVKALEAHLRATLFERLPRRLELTRSGKKLLPVVRDSFDAINRTINEMHLDLAGSALTVRLAPSFAAHWLSPRLEDFLRRFPDIELSLKLSNAPVDFSRDGIDIAVTYGAGNWPATVAESLLTLDFFPVCSPNSLRCETPLNVPDDLRHFTLLHDGDDQNWCDWLQLAGCHDIDGTHGTVMDDTNVLIQAAVDGLGIALGSSPFVSEHLDSGKLVQPFDVILQSNFAYYVVCPRSHLDRAEVRTFREWLLRFSKIGDVAEVA